MFGCFSGIDLSTVRGIQAFELLGDAFAVLPRRISDYHVELSLWLSRRQRELTSLFERVQRSISRGCFERHRIDIDPPNKLGTRHQRYEREHAGAGAEVQHR